MWGLEQKLQRQCIFRGVSSCQMCQSYKAEFICRQCEKLICNSCANNPQTDAKLLSHKIIAIDISVAEEKETGLYAKCKCHDCFLIYYCKICEESVCISCICQPKHTTHYKEIVELQTGIMAMCEKLRCKELANPRCLSTIREILT